VPRVNYMRSEALPYAPSHNGRAVSKPIPQTLCSICNRPVSLENAKTEEHGLAIHEECYLLKLKLKRATSADPW
jgi:hypothetical protein